MGRRFLRGGFGYAAWMMNRFRIYMENRGRLGLLGWVAILVFLIWNQFRVFTPAFAAVMLVGLALCLVAPLAIMPLSERDPARSARRQQIIWNGLLGVLLLSFVVQYHPLLWLGFTLVLFFMFGWGFWFYSSPAVVTNRRWSGIQDRAMDAEESALRREVEANQRELDAMGGSGGLTGASDGRPEDGRERG